MRMPGKFPLLLVITVILIAGCITIVPEDTPGEIPATGSVEVSSTPPGVEVYLDNVYRGTTPVTVFDLSGSHILELRLRDHQSWSKSILLEGDTKVSVDTSLAPVPVITSLPALTPTTVPMTRPTTRSTTPVPETPAGCWIYEIVQTDFTVSYTYELDSGGTGWVICKGIDKCLPPQELTWSQNPDPLDPERSVLVAIHPANLGERVLTWDARADILAYGESDNHVIVLRRITCSQKGLTIGAA